MKTTVVCSMRNEGPFLLEWVVWYRLLGFTDLLMVTNDCTDHSPALLDALQVAGWVTHLRCDVPPGQKVVQTKLRAARAHEAVRRADWVLVCDVDEFLVIHRGAGLLADLLGTEPDFLAMAINWRVFGTAGVQRWEDGLTHRQFRRCGPTENWISRWIKVLHRKPLWFRALGEHGPKGLNLEKAGRPWGGRGMRFVNSEGVDVPDWTPEGKYLRMLPPGLTTHVVAQMNHYMLRSEESFGLKRGSLSSVQGADRYNDSYYKSTNRNELRDSAALRHTQAFDVLHAQVMALPDVARLHHQCCADYVVRLCDKAGVRPQDDARWQHHMAQVAGLVG